MRIKTQFVLTMLLFGVVLAAIATSAIVTNRQMEKARAQDQLAHSIAQGAAELSYLANDYVMYRESQQLERWRARFERFSADVAQLQSSRPAQQALIRTIQANAQRLAFVFDGVVSTVDVQRGSAAADLQMLRISWSRIAVQSQTLTSDASRLSQLLSAQADQLQRTNSIVVIALIGGFVAYFLVNYWTVQRRMLQSIATLQAGTAVIGSGNLDFRIEEKSDDEVGDLSRAFNRMTRDLQTATDALLQGERLSTAGRLAASVAHEINNPLQAVLGCLGLAQEAVKEGHPPDRYLQIAHDEVQRTARIVGQLRSLGRPVQDGNREQADLNRLFDDVLVLNKRYLQGRKIDLVWEPDPELPSVLVVRDAMRQVFLNLVLNAVDAMPEGGQLRVTTSRVESPAGVRIAVADSGIGIPPEALPHLFEAFYTTKEEGMGVGLYISKRIVQQHGGQIEVESQFTAATQGLEGTGSTFTVWLPGEGLGTQPAHTAPQNAVGETES